jgi:hypothetical protein
VEFLIIAVSAKCISLLRLREHSTRYTKVQNKIRKHFLHLLSPGEYSPPKKMIEFSRKQQEQKIVHDIKEEVDHLKRDQVDLEVWILQLLKLMVYTKKKNQRRVLFIFNLIFFSFY